MNREKILAKFIIASVLVGGINFAPAVVHFDEKNLQIISVAHAEIKTIEAVGRAEFNMAETPQLVELSKNYARMTAVQAAKEKAGVYLKSQSKMINGILTEDDISVVASNTAEIIDVQYKKVPYASIDVKGNETGEIGIAYEATVTVKIDSDELSRYIQRDDKSTLIQQNNYSQKNIAEINKNVADLQKNNQITSEEIEEINNKILEQQKFEEGRKKIDEAIHLYSKKDYQGAIAIYDEMLKLDPNFFHSGSLSRYYREVYFTQAYSNRGEAYYALKKYKQAISDFDKSIEIFPKAASVYLDRGNAYFRLKKYKQAISDFNDAIKYETEFRNSVNHFNDVNGTSYKFPSLIYPEAYAFRGYSHFFEKNYQQAISDFTKAIETHSIYTPYNIANVYHTRGLIYKHFLRENAKAEADFKKAHELGWNG